MPVLLTEKLKVLRPHAAALEYPDIVLNDGEHRLLTGPSGRGKSTLLSVIAGLLPPTSGSVRLLDRDLYTMPGRDRDRLRGAKIGFVFQNLHLVPSLTVRQNISLALPSSADGKESRIKTVLESLRLKELQDKRPHALSQGEKQRAAIARAVVGRPSLIIADEPTSALDDENAMIVAALLRDCARDAGAALLIATHDSRLRHFIPDTIDLTGCGKAVAA